jgi:hypothetical protein
MLGQKLQEESSFSEEKEAKRLLQMCLGDRVGLGANTPMGKSFLLLFFKKEVLPLNFSELRAYGAEPRPFLPLTQAHP